MYFPLHLSQMFRFMQFFFYALSIRLFFQMQLYLGVRFLSQNALTLFAQAQLPA